VGRSRSPSSGSRNLMSPFESFFNEMDKNFFGENMWPEMTREELAEFSPSIDLEENDEMYLITADLPGIKSDDIKIDVVGNKIKISGERRREVKGEGLYERSQGHFSRSLTLPENIDVKKVEANFEDGVLRVVLPKTEIKSSQQIKVHSGPPQGLIDRFIHREKTVEPIKEQSKH